MVRDKLKILLFNLFLTIFPMSNQFDTLLSSILNSWKKLILIAWPSSSWKSYIAHQLKEILESKFSKKVLVLPTDDYYKDNTLVYYLLYWSYDHPNLINFSLLNKHLYNLLNWKSILKPIYSFKDKMIIDWEKVDAWYDFIIVEWLYTLNFLRKQFLSQAYKVFINVNKEELILRRIIRDPQRTKEPLDRILNSLLAVFPMWNIYWKNQRKKADFIFFSDYQIIKDKGKVFKLVSNFEKNYNFSEKEVSFVVDYYYSSDNKGEWNFLIVREIYKRWYFRWVSIIKQYQEGDKLKIYEIFINQPWFLKEAHILLQIAWLKYKKYQKWKIIKYIDEKGKSIVVYINKKEKKIFEEV